MSRKNRGQSNTPTPGDSADLQGQDVEDNETSQNDAQDLTEGLGNSDEDSSDVGSDQSWAGAEDVSGLDSDLLLDDATQVQKLGAGAEEAFVVPSDAINADGVVSTDVTNAPSLESGVVEAPTVDSQDVQGTAGDATIEPAPEPSAETATAAPEPIPAPAPVEEAAQDHATLPIRQRLAGLLEADALAALDNKGLILFEEKRMLPVKTSHNEWPVDLRRTKDMTTWSDGALVDWLNGEINTPRNVLAEALADELYRRYKLPANWSLESASAFIATGVKPEYTLSGVLIADRARDNTPLNHWAFKDIKAGLLDEIEIGTHSKDDLVSALRSRLGLSNATSQEKILESLNANTDEATMDDSILDARLSSFKAAMTPQGKVLSAISAGEAQASLWSIILDVLKRDPQTFQEGWVKLLNFVNTEYNTLFTPERARKGWAQIKLPKTTLATFEDVLTLLINTRNGATRMQDAKQHKIVHMLRYATEEQRMNVVNFYTVHGQ